jgi:hypothetical protein
MPFIVAPSRGNLQWMLLKAADLPAADSSASVFDYPASQDVSTSGGFRGCLCLRLRWRADGLGRNFESILVHIESLFPVQAFDKLAYRLTNGSRKTRRIHFDRRFHRPFISISIAELHLKRFHAPNLPFLTMNIETGSRNPNHVQVLKLLGALPPVTLTTRSFRSGALRFPGLNLCLKRLVLFRQRIAGSCHCFEIVSQLAVLFLKVRHMGLQLLVLLQGFCVLAGSQGQTQHYRHGKSRPSVFARHSSSFLHKNLNRKWSNR